MRDETLERKKRWLYRYRNNHYKLLRLKEKLSALNDRITSVKAPKLSGMLRGGVPVTLDDLLSDKDILEERIKRLEDKEEIYLRETLEVIDKLDNYSHAEVLEYWFIKCYKPEQIAEQIGYSSRHIFRIYSEALKEIEIPPGDGK